MRKFSFLLLLIIIDFPVNRQNFVSTFFNGIIGQRKSKSFEFLDEDSLSMMTAVQRCNYNITKHTVITDDKYHIDIFSIYKSNITDDGIAKKNPVLFFHGLYGTSNTWIMSGCDVALPYALADQGHVIWMANNRGNVHGDKHEKYNITNDKFWDFSWYDIANFDLPQIVKYVYAKSDNQTMYYVGHSQGTLIMTAWGSEPKNNATTYIKGFLALSPLYRITSTFSGAFVLSSFFELYNFSEIIDRASLKKLAIQFVVNLCHQFDVYVCQKILVLTGIKCDDDIQKTIFSFIKTFKHRTSYKNMIHYFQMIATHETRAYDYGADKNKIIYGSTTPPSIDARILNIPTVVYYGGKDTTSPSNNVQTFIGIIPNLVETFYYPKARFSHFIKAQSDKITLQADIIRGLDLIEQKSIKP